jgi:SNF2 family DNA or RNA helicase
LDNWLNEFEKFSPDMVIVPYRGSQTERFHLARDLLKDVKNESVDVIICTYTMFERESGKEDRKFLKRIDFSYLVLDEAHCIKNSSSSRFETLRQLRTSRRLLLSGTPVQNDVKELLTLLSFLTPKVFRPKDIDMLLTGLAVDEKNGYRGTVNELVPIRHIRTMMAPFVMRRLKIDVLGQLPSKTVTPKLLTMGSIQQKVYDNIIRTQLHRKEVSNNSKDGMDEATLLAVAGVSASVGEGAGGSPPVSPGEKKKLIAKAKKQIRAEKELQELTACTGPRGGAGAGGGKKGASDADAVVNEFQIVNLADGNDDDVDKKDLQGMDTDIDSMLGRMRTGDINNLFTALKKAANHPLLLRVHYTADPTIDLVARVALAHNHFGEQAGYDRVRAEICTFSDFDIHHLCLEYPSSLGHLKLSSEVLDNSIKIMMLKEMLPTLVVRRCHTDRYRI